MGDDQMIGPHGREGIGKYLNFYITAQHMHRRRQHFVNNIPTLEKDIV
jgi:hypothetical protein